MWSYKTAEVLQCVELYSLLVIPAVEHAKESSQWRGVQLVVDR